MPTPHTPREADGPRRRRRSDHGTIRFWERDGELLSFASEQHAITIEQLARLTSGNRTTAYNLRDRWVRAGWVESHALIWRGPAFLWLTREGARIVQSPYRAVPPNPGLATHTAAVTDVRLLLERELSLGAWDCERSLAKAGWTRGEPPPHLPDGVLRCAAGRVAIEVELTLKGSTRLDLILAELGRRYPEVWYFASVRVRPTLERLAAESPWRNVRVFPFPACSEDVCP